MRIGIDARLRAYRGGGISEHIARLLSGLDALSPPEDFVVLEHRRGRRSEDSADKSSQPFESRALWTPPHHVLESWSLPVELVPLRLDLLHSTDSVVPRAWRGASVATVHDVAFLRHPELLTGNSLRYYGRVAESVRRADLTITVSEHTRSELCALAGADRERVRVVPNAIPQRFFAPGDAAADLRVAERYGLQPPFALFVSTVEPRKNIGTLLAAYRKMLDDGRELGLALAGADGWRSEAVYGLVENLGLGGRARFLGFVPDEELLALYRTAAVLAHPALDEGFGMTPLEAMAAGTPAVVSDIPGLAETVGDAAERVPPDDPAAWAAALARLLDDPDRVTEMTSAGRSRAQSFSEERMARATLEVYREVVGRGGKAGSAASMERRE